MTAPLSPHSPTREWFEVTLPAPTACAAVVSLPDCAPVVAVGLATGHLQVHSLQAGLLHRQRVLKHAVSALSVGSVQLAGISQACLCLASKSAVVCIPLAQVRRQAAGIPGSAGAH